MTRLYALGIDIGSTFTTAAVFSDGVVETLKLDPGVDALPTVVHVAGNPDSWTVGSAALRASAREPHALARTFTSALGQSDPLYFGGAPLRPEDLVARVLAHVVGVAESSLGARPAHVTLTHPAHWGLHTLGVLRVVIESLAITAAGLVPEPVAVATHYGAEHRLAAGTPLAVLDIGGSSVEAAVLRKTSGGFELVGPSLGSEAIGGNEFDRALTEFLGKRLGEGWAAADPFDPVVMREMETLRDHARQAKERLSSDLDVDVDVEIGGSSLQVRLTRREYETLIRPHVDNALELIEEAAAEAEVAIADLAGVVLSGGSSRTPLVAAQLSERFGTLPLLRGDPRYAACLGAAITAAASGGLVQHGGFDVPPEPVRRDTAPDTSEADTSGADTSEVGRSIDDRALDDLAVVDRTSDPDVSLVVDLDQQDLAASVDRNMLQVPVAPTVEPIRRQLAPIKVVPVQVEAMHDIDTPRTDLLRTAAVALAVLVVLVVLLLVLA